MHASVAAIAALFDAEGHVCYDGARAEAVTALEHALQCAQLAEWAGARPGLVAAALLHDVGHFVAPRSGTNDIDDLDDAHELRALPLLGATFGPDVVEPVRLHVAAKRWLVAADGDYASTLSAASIHSLALQGGAMGLDEAVAFVSVPYARDAIALRRWDDLAKQPGRTTPPLGYYLALLDEVAGQDTRAPRA